MLGIFEALFARLGGSAVMVGLGAIIQRFRPVRITTQKAPRNFFEHFGPGVTKDFVKSKIGAPHRLTDCQWSYQFSDALAQFDFSDGDSARSVALALTNESPTAGFDLPGIGIPLGKLRFDDFDSADGGTISYRSTMKTWELLYCVKFPPHWASSYFTFGALSVITPFKLKESMFDTEVAQSDAKLASAGVVFNWVGISSAPDDMWFDWSIAAPASM